MKILTFAGAALLAGCAADIPAGQNFADNVSAVQEIPAGEGNGDDDLTTSVAARDYSGRWTGTGNDSLVVSAGPAPGRYTLAIRSGRDATIVQGEASGDTIVFRRGTKAETLTPTDGKATGIPALADRRDCLTVAPGEGYCRN